MHGVPVRRAAPGSEGRPRNRGNPPGQVFSANWSESRLPSRRARDLRARRPAAVWLCKARKTGRPARQELPAIGAPVHQVLLVAGLWHGRSDTFGPRPLRKIPPHVHLWVRPRLGPVRSVPGDGHAHRMKGVTMRTDQVPAREIAERPEGYQGPNLSPAGLKLRAHKFTGGVYALMVNIPPKDNNGVIAGRGDEPLPGADRARPARHARSLPEQSPAQHPGHLPPAPGSSFGRRARMTDSRRRPAGPARGGKSRKTIRQGDAAEVTRGRQRSASRVECVIDAALGPRLATSGDSSGER
jgi:hypothetical protein